MMKKVIFKVNGCSHQFIVDNDFVLLDLLREDLRLTGAKQSCDQLDPFTKLSSPVGSGDHRSLGGYWP